MPKLKYSEQQTKNRAFQAVVMKQLTLLDIGKDDLAQALCMSRSTLWAKLNDPMQFRVGELDQLYRILKFNSEEKSFLF